MISCRKILFLLAFLMINGNLFAGDMKINGDGVAICGSDIKSIQLNDNHKKSSLYKILKSSKSVTFIGDSVSEGKLNNGCGWYESLVSSFPDLTIVKKAWGAHTIKMIIEKNSIISRDVTDTYVIAIGTNDVRYRNSDKAATDSVSYIDQIRILISYLKDSNENANIILIGIWPSIDSDPLLVDKNERLKLTNEYNDSLRKYSEDYGYIFINPSQQIESAFMNDGAYTYLLDYIHPNDNGVYLYSNAVLSN